MEGQVFWETPHDEKHQFSQWETTHPTTAIFGEGELSLSLVFSVRWAKLQPDKVDRE